jgi:hypothetical protein
VSYTARLHNGFAFAALIEVYGFGFSFLTVPHRSVKLDLRRLTSELTYSFAYKFLGVGVRV